MNDTLIGRSDDLFAFLQLVKRHCKVFLKDRMAVFFSLLAPIIVFLLYVLFLGDLQEDTVLSFFPEGVTVPDGAVSAFVDSWMVSGVLGSACFTVSFSANNHNGAGQVQRADPRLPRFSREKDDGDSCLLRVQFHRDGGCRGLRRPALFCLSRGNGWIPHVGGRRIRDARKCRVLRALVHPLFRVRLCSFFRTEGALSGFIGIVSAAIGFLIGAYMPLSAFPRRRGISRRAASRHAYRRGCSETF